MRRLVLGALIFILILGLVAVSASARKKLVRQNTIPVGSFWNKLKLRSDHQALLLLLGGMQHASKIEYQLTYSTNGVAQGINGSHEPALGNTQKELVFGTCSNNDCIAATNITDMIFELRVALENGQTLVKRYQISP